MIAIRKENKNNNIRLMHYTEIINDVIVVIRVHCLTFGAHI